MDPNNNGAEAARWVSIAERLLIARDLHGAKSFAIRARDSDPSIRIEFADQIIAVADTLIAGETRTIRDQHDWYAILQLAPLTHSLDLIATQYRRLALLLHPERNRIAYADYAFKLVCDAWSVLSNPSKKADYDNALSVNSASGSTQPPHHKEQQEPLMRRSPRTKDGKAVVEEDGPSFNNVAESTRQPRPTAEPARPKESTRKTLPTEPESSSFWTACPYCYVLYEYPRVYEDCTLRCQDCKRAFHGVMIPSPPVTDKDTYFCCWAFFPLGLSVNAKDTSGSSKWTPISSMFACPVQASGSNRNVSKRNSGPWVFYDDEEALQEISESSEDSDDEWGSGRRKRKAKKRASASANAKKVQNDRVKKGQPNMGIGENLDSSRADSSKRATAAGGARKRGTTELGKLDLNVEFSNEAEEPARGISAGNGEEDNIEGIGFFEGLDEFLSSLPILKG